MKHQIEVKFTIEVSTDDPRGVAKALREQLKAVEPSDILTCDELLGGNLGNVSVRPVSQTIESDFLIEAENNA